MAKAKHNGGGGLEEGASLSYKHFLKPHPQSGSFCQGKECPLSLPLIIIGFLV